MLMRYKSSSKSYSICIFCLTAFFLRITQCRDISFGALIREDEEDDLASSVKIAMSFNNRSWGNNIITDSKSLDAFKLGQEVCTLINDGHKILLATGDWRTHSIFKSLSEQFNLPYINWAAPSRAASPFEISIYPPFYYAIADFVKWKKWSRLIYVYDTEAGIWNQRALLAQLGMNNLTIESIQLPHWVQKNGTAPNYFQFFLDFHKRFYMGNHTVVLDIERLVTLKKILVDLQKAAMKAGNFHYVVASYDVNSTDLKQFRVGQMNITIMQIILNEDSKKYQQIQKHWRDTLKLSYSKSVDKFHRLTPRACFAYDSILMMNEAISRVLTRDREWYETHKQSKEVTFCQMDTDKDLPSSAANMKTERNSVELAKTLVEAMKEVRMEGLSGMIEFNENGTRVNYELNFTSLEFRNTNEGPVGFFTNFTWMQGENLTVQMQGEEFASKILNEILDDNQFETKFPNDVVTITTVELEPFVMWNAKDKKYEGYCIDLIDELRKKLGFKTILSPAKNNEYGKVTEGGRWDGMIGDLLDKRAHMAVAPLTISRVRERVVDFSKPFITTGISIMIKKPDKQEFSVFSFMQPLSREVWMYIIFAYIGVSVVIFLISRFSPYEWRVEEGAHGTYTISNDFSIYNCLWFTLAAFMQQGTDILPRSVSGRIASSAWWFFTMIIVSSYTANLAAFLTMEKMRADIESVEDLVKQTKIKYGIKDGGSTATFFKESTVQVHQRMWQYMESNRLEVMVDDYNKGIAKVRESKGNYAFLLEQTANDYANTKKPCDTMKVPGLLNTIGYGVATKFGSKYSRAINLAILQLQESGDLKRLENKWWHEKGQCEQGGMTDSQSASLTLSKVAGIFYILMGGMIVAMIAAFGEFYHRKRKQARKNRDDSMGGGLGSSAHLTGDNTKK